MNKPGDAAVIRGEVRDRNGDPVAGARVVISESPVPVPEIAAVTDAAGRFTLSAPAAGSYGLTAHAESPTAGVAKVDVFVAPGESPVRSGPRSPFELFDPNEEVGSDDLPALPAPEGQPAQREVEAVLIFGQVADGEG